jgi:hypothetical protein
MNAQLRQDVYDLAFEGLEVTEIATVLGVDESDVVAAFDDTDSYEDAMDGDFDSAMSSAGYGMDEDYMFGPSIYED